MSMINLHHAATVFLVSDVTQVPTGATEKPSNPITTHNLPPSQVQRSTDGSHSLRALRLDELADASIESTNRGKRKAGSVAPPSPSKAGGGGARYPARAQSTTADTKLQKNLLHWLETGTPTDNAIPKKASIAPFISFYNQAIKDPALLAWLKNTGFKPETVRIFGDSVVGIVSRDGKETLQRFTTTDGSGWGQVSPRVCALQRILSPNDLGIPIATGTSEVVVPLSVLLDFYAVKPPENERAAPRLGKQLKSSGWPSLSPMQRDQWEKQFDQQKRDLQDGALRGRLSELLQPLLKGKEDNDKLNLNELSVAAKPGSTLDQRSKKPRELFLKFLASPAFQAFMKKDRLERPGSEFEYRLSEGDLQTRNGAGQWMSLQQAFEKEVQHASVFGSAEGQAAARAMNTQFDQLLKMSKKTGDALYSTRTYDARQAMAHYALDVPQTVSQLRASLSSFNTQLSKPPLGGNYASMTPYGQEAMSDTTRETFNRASVQVMALFKGFSPSLTDFQSYPDPDSQLADFFDSPGASALAETLARSLKLFSVADGQGLSRADRYQLLATALKFSVDATVPGLPGTVAGYELYMPANMGRTLKAVRGDVEKHLVGKGVDPKVSALMAHLYLAQSAPEMLIKRNPSIPADTARLLNQDPETIKVGSTGWMNMRLASAIAGESRLNLQQALALARQDAGGPHQEELVKRLGAQALLDWGVMAGIFPAMSDRAYSAGDYAAASKAFTERENTTRAAFETLASEPPSQASVLVKQLALLFPEMTEEEIRTSRLDLDTDEPYVPRNQAHLETRRPLLVEFILAGQAEDASFLLKLDQNIGAVFTGDKKYNFIHPKISQATFFQRISQLPVIASLVEPAVDNYINDIRKAQATALKLTIAQLPLKQRMALESSKEIQFFTLRTATGDSLETDKAPGSAVAKKRGAHGLLMRYETGQTQPRYGYYEVFPNSMKMIRRMDLPDNMELGDNITKGRKPTGLGGYYPIDVQQGISLPFDFEAYHSGSLPRLGVSSQVIIEAHGAPLSGTGGSSNQRIPNTFASSRTSRIVETMLAYSFDGKRDALIEFANQPTKLESRRAYPFESGKNIFTAENARTMLSLIPFVGAFADLLEGNTEAGVKGLLIDVASFIATGGLAGVKNVAKGLRLLVRFNDKPFTMAALKGGSTFLRGLFNPVENVPGILRAGPNGVNALKMIAKGRPTHIGSNVYLPVTAYEQWRWTLGARDALSAGSNDSGSKWPGARKGASGKREVYAVQKNGSWYAINALSHRPEGAPLEQFIPMVE